MASTEPEVRDWVGRMAVTTLLVVSGLLMLTWSLAVPAWEASDEPDHWQYAAYMHDHGSLPPYDLAHLEANEPPLYYALLSPIANDQAPPVRDIVTNAKGQSYYPGYPRLFYPSAHDLTDNWRLHLGRIVTIGISLLTVFFAFLAGTEATKRRTTGLLAGMLVGLLPAFSFRGMTVSPDALLAMFCALTTYLIVRMMRRGFSWRLGIAIGVVAGGAFLSKITGIVILVGAATAIALDRSIPWSQRIRHMTPLALAGVVASPWLLYNQLTYGDPLARGPLYSTFKDVIQPHPLFSTYFIDQFPVTLAITSIGDFGWSDVGMSPLLYGIYGILLSVVVVGIYVAARQQPQVRKLFIVIGVLFCAAMVTIVGINLTIQQPQGRYLLTVIPALAIAGAIGLEATPGWRRHSRAATAGLGLILTALQIIVLTTVIVPAYAIPT